MQEAGSQEVGLSNAGGKAVQRERVSFTVKAQMIVTSDFTLVILRCCTTSLCYGDRVADNGMKLLTSDAFHGRKRAQRQP